MNDFQDKPIESKTKKCPYAKWLSLFATVLLLLAIGTSLAVGRLLWNEIANLKSNNASVETQLKNIQQQLPALQHEIKSQQESINEWLNQAKASKKHWIYREVSYLVKQASYQLKLDNLKGAMGLCNDALTTLNTVSSADAGEIKSQLVKVIQVLKATKSVNRDDLIHQLDQLKAQVNQLPLNLPKSSNLPVVDRPKHTASGLLKPLQESWEQIKQLIVIRHHEKPVEPLITPLQDVYLKQNLQLQLEQVCMAVLYRDPDLYRSSLQKVNAWVKQFFDPRAASTQAFLKTTDRLLQMNIAPASPNVFADLSEILENSNRTSAFFATANQMS